MLPNVGIDEKILIVYWLSVRTLFGRPVFDSRRGMQSTPLLVAQPVRSRALNTAGPLYEL